MSYLHQWILSQRGRGEPHFTLSLCKQAHLSCSREFWLGREKPSSTLLLLPFLPFLFPSLRRYEKIRLTLTFHLLVDQHQRAQIKYTHLIDSIHMNTEYGAWNVIQIFIFLNEIQDAPIFEPLFLSLGPPYWHWALWRRMHIKQKSGWRVSVHLQLLSF